MKKKFPLALLGMIFCFTLGGFYIAHSIKNIVNKLEIITTLHQVEHFQQDLQNKIKVLQTDLRLKDSPHALHIDTFAKMVWFRQEVA